MYCFNKEQWWTYYWAMPSLFPLYKLSDLSMFLRGDVILIINSRFFRCWKLTSIIQQILQSIKFLPSSAQAAILSFFRSNCDIFKVLVWA